MILLTRANIERFKVTPNALTNDLLFWKQLVSVIGFPNREKIYKAVFVNK